MLVSKRSGRLRIIAASQVAGGGLGLLSFYLLSGQVLVIGHLLLLSLASFAIWAGTELWRGKRRGLDLSIYCQFLQIPILLGSLFSYKCLIGPYFVAGYFPGQAPVALGFQIEAFVYINATGIDPGFGINLVALAFLVVLFRTSDSEYKDYCREVGLRTSRKESESVQ